MNAPSVTNTTTNTPLEDRQNSLVTIEDMISSKLVDRFNQIFGCPVAITTADDKTQIANRLTNGTGLKYPYAFLVPGAVGKNSDSYNGHMMARRGIPVIVNDGFAATVKILPCNFDFDVEYVTNKYDGNVDSVRSFEREWLFAWRLGYLKFDVNYGRLNLMVGITLSDSITVPARESVTEGSAEYRVPATITVHGYMSKPTLSRVGVITDLVINGQKMNSDGSLEGPNNTFMPFLSNK